MEGSACETLFFAERHRRRSGWRCQGRARASVHGCGVWRPLRLAAERHATRASSLSTFSRSRGRRKTQVARSTFRPDSSTLRSVAPGHSASCGARLENSLAARLIPAYAAPLRLPQDSPSHIGRLRLQPATLPGAAERLSDTGRFVDLRDTGPPDTRSGDQQRSSGQGACRLNSLARSP